MVVLGAGFGLYIRLRFTGRKDNGLLHNRCSNGHYRISDFQEKKIAAISLTCLPEATNIFNDEVSTVDQAVRCFLQYVRKLFDKTVVNVLRCTVLIQIY